MPEIVTPIEKPEPNRTLIRAARLAGMCAAYARVLRRMEASGLGTTPVFAAIYDELMKADEDFASRESWE